MQWSPIKSMHVLTVLFAFTELEEIHRFWLSWNCSTKQLLTSTNPIVMRSGIIRTDKSRTLKKKIKKKSELFLFVENW